MRNSTIFWIIAVIIILGGAVVIWTTASNNTVQESPNVPVTSTSSVGTTPPSDKSISDGVITVEYPSDIFGLAANKAQITVSSYIPPCDDNLGYCFYYTGSAYSGTNFESAGLRVVKRTDLTTQAKCLSTLPDGFTNIKPEIASSSDYATSIFTPLNDAATGHYASGSLYRLAFQGNCYEFETRVGYSQFANYPAGSIKEFTTADQTIVQSMLEHILSEVMLPTGEKNLFVRGSSAS